MNSYFILFLLITASILPLIVLYIIFRKDNKISLLYFLLSVSMGGISLLIAAIIQRYIPIPANMGNIGVVFFSIFIRIALVEEGSRLITLFPLLKTGNKIQDIGSASRLGLAAGLGFAALENAFYGTIDINIALLRIFSASPLHGACGIRTAAALHKFPSKPVSAIFMFASAILIHGAYNLIILIPIIPSLIAIPVALAALLISLPLTRE